MKVRTESYQTREGLEFVEIGREYYFGELCDGNGNVKELLESGSIAMYYASDEFVIVEFEIVSKNDEIMDTIIKVIDVN